MRHLFSMLSWPKGFAIALVLIMMLCGCSSLNTQRARVPLDTRISEQDFRSACEQAARSLIGIPQISNAVQPPCVAIIGIENRSENYIDKDIYLEKMRTIILQNSRGKITFLDRKIMNQIQEERKAKRDGERTASKSVNVYGADYFLTGKIFSDTQVQGGKRYTFARYAFRLTDAETSAIVWENEYESQVLNKKALFNR